MASPVKMLHILVCVSKVLMFLDLRVWHPMIIFSVSEKTDVLGLCAKEILIFLGGNIKNDDLGDLCIYHKYYAEWAAIDKS